MTEQRVSGSYRASTPTPVPEPIPAPPEPVTPDSPEPTQPPLPSYEDQPPVNPVAGRTALTPKRELAAMAFWRVSSRRDVA